MSYRRRCWLHWIFGRMSDGEAAEAGIEIILSRQMFPDLQSLHKTLSQLQHARRLLARPKGWTQGSYARDGHGASVDSRCSDATSFCASGAIYAAQDDLAGSIQARTVIYRIIADDIEAWNDADGRSQADIVKAFDQAISSIKTMAQRFCDT